MNVELIESRLCDCLAERIASAQQLVWAGQTGRGLRRIAAYSAFRQRHCLKRVRKCPVCGRELAGWQKIYCSPACRTTGQRTK